MAREKLRELIQQGYMCVESCVSSVIAQGATIDELNDCAREDVQGVIEEHLRYTSDVARLWVDLDYPGTEIDAGTVDLKECLKQAVKDELQRRMDVEQKVHNILVLEYTPLCGMCDTLVLELPVGRVNGGMNGLCGRCGGDLQHEERIVFFSTECL